VRYIVNPMFNRGLAGLGLDTTSEPNVDTASVLRTGASLRQAQAELTTILETMQQNPQLAQAIGRDVVAQQQALGDLIAKYVYVHTAIFGTPPAGLGQVPVIAAVAAVFALIIAGLAVWWEKEAAIRQQAQAVTVASQNQAAILAQAAALQQRADAATAAGDAASAAAYTAQANQLFQQAGVPNVSGQVAPPKPASLAEWFQENWVTAALIVAGVIVIPRIVGEL
jgi:hypothetical protein